MTDDEQQLLRNVKGPRTAPHSSSWLMFTPTTLLQQYVKESFSREGIPASDRHVRTWTNFRRELARNVLGLLRTPTNQRGFVLRETVPYLLDDARHRLTFWFDDFHDFQQTSFVDRLRNAAKELQSLGQGKSAEMGSTVRALLNSHHFDEIGPLLRSLQSISNDARELVAKLTSDVDQQIRRALIVQVNRDRYFLDSFATFLDGLSDASNERTGDGDGSDEEEDDDIEDDPNLRTGRRGAEIEYRRAARRQARATASGRSVRKGSRAEQIAEWIGDRGIPQTVRVNVGHELLLLSSIRPFVRPMRTYLNGMPARYRRFRRSRQTMQRWYRAVSINSADIDSLELDMLLLAILREARRLLLATEVRQNLRDPYWSALDPVHDECRNQIFVDEATDFSPVQLACMAALSHPATQSFFACGDFNQRLTVFGSRSLSEIRWAIPDIRSEGITVGYRQSKELNALAREIAKKAGDAEHDVQLPTYAEESGVAPALAEGISDYSDVSQWLATRVMEIESFLRILPSIAILVPEESQVYPLAEALNIAVSEQNMRVVACPNGQVFGQDNDIRVFDAQHIKGLEFEAVFFKDVDRLAELYPELFDKFLYVGATRAATYFGMTCSNALPSVISELREMFTATWN